MGYPNEESCFGSPILFVFVCEYVLVLVHIRTSKPI